MSVLNRVKHFRFDNFFDWFNTFIKVGLLKPGGDELSNTYYLNTPLQFLFKQKVVTSLQRRYKPDFEIGGILLAEPVRMGSRKILLVNGVRHIRNVSGNPRSYLPRAESWNKYVRSCFEGTKNRKRYLPIRFHTHLRGTDELMEMLMTYFKMSTSAADKKAASKTFNFQLGDDSIRLVLPSCLCIVAETGEVFLGVYGCNVAPNDFTQYSEKILGKTMKDAVKWGTESESILQNILGIIAGIGVGFISIGLRKKNYLRSLAMLITMTRKEYAADNNYFTMAKKGDIIIDIPEL